MGGRAHRWLTAAVLLSGCNGILGIDEPTVNVPDAAIVVDAAPPTFDARRFDARVIVIDAAVADAKIDAPIAPVDAAPVDAAPVDAAAVDAPPTVDAMVDAPP